MSTRNFVYYDNFNEGETGEHGDFLDGYRLFRGILIYRGTWHGTNVQRNIDGTISARPGLKKVALTGVPTGTVLGFGSTPVPGADGFFVIGTAVYGFDVLNGGAVFTYTGALAKTPTFPVAYCGVGTGVFITSQGDQTYFLDPVAKTCTAVTNSPGGTAICVYGDRLCVGNMGGVNANQVQYSNAYTPGNAPAQRYPFPAVANFFSVGDDFQVTGLFPQRTHLAISKQTGWWVQTGTLGVNDVQRHVLVADAPLWWTHADLQTSGRIFYVPLFRDEPAIFNGSVAAEEHHLRFANKTYVQPANGLTPAFAATRMVKPEDMFLTSTVANTAGANKAAVFHNGAWGFHTWGVNVAWAAYGNVNGTYLCDAGGVGVAPNVYIFPHELDRPVKSTDARANFGDASTTFLAASFTLPEWESRDGAEIVVRGVMVSFKKWNTGSLQNNHFDLTVTSLRQWNKPGNTVGQPSITKTFDEPPADTITDGQYHEKTYFFGDQSKGNGFRLDFANLRGVAIHKVQVIIDQLEARV